jgi:enoyl-CoA hydratase
MIPIFYLDRPEVANALDLKTAEKLKKELDLAVKSKAQGFIITSKSPKNFCSGGDKKSYAQLKSKKEGVERNRKIRKILSEFKSKPLLVICAIEGDAVGGGCELALACDFIFTSASARFAFKQVGQGLTPGWGGMKNLLDRVSKAKALDWLTSGRWISSTEALQAGLFDQVTSSGNVVALAQSFLEEHPQELISTIKNLVVTEGRFEEKVFDKLWWSKVHLASLKE